MVCGGGTLSRVGLPGFGSASLQRPEIPGSGLPGFQSDLNGDNEDFTISFSVKIFVRLHMQQFERHIRQLRKHVIICGKSAGWCRVELPNGRCFQTSAFASLLTSR